MSNNITIELCAEDRARLDRLAEALERRTCDKCVTAAVECMRANLEPKTELDPVQQAFADTMKKAEEAAADAEIPTEATHPPEEETQPIDEPTPPPTEPVVDREELKAKVIKLCAKGFKEQARDIVRAYAQTVTAIPDEKLAECYAKLVALEG